MLRWTSLTVLALLTTSASGQPRKDGPKAGDTPKPTDAATTKADADRAVDAAKRADESATKAKTSEDNAAVSKETATKAADDAKKAFADVQDALRKQAQEDANGGKTGTEPKDPQPAPAPDSTFTNVEFFGSANLLAGSLFSEDGTLATNGGLGVAAQHKSLSLVAAFSFGSDVSSDVTTRDDYDNFIRSPSSALGVQVQPRWTWPDKGSVRAGVTVPIRLNSRSFNYGDGRTERISLFTADPSATVLMTFPGEHPVTIFNEIGLATRVWEKPHADFINGVGIRGDAHTFYGVRLLLAASVGSIHVGIEAMRLSGPGDDLKSLEEFRILPYVGFTGGLNREPPKKPTEDECKKATAERARGIVTPEPPPPPTPLP